MLTDSELPLIDLTSPHLPPMGEVRFKTNDGIYVVSMNSFLSVAEKLDWNVLETIKMLRIVRQPNGFHISLGSLKKIVEYIFQRYKPVR